MADWIVVVDDDEMSLRMAGHILSKHNKRVTALKSGKALLGYIKENKPDLILLDINMPEMDGFETFDRLKELMNAQEIDEIPIIFLTAEGDSSVENRGFKAGVSDYIRKPFNPEILIRRIDNILNNQEKMHQYQEEATKDKLTGLLNKGAIAEKMEILCHKNSGYFMIMDLDAFKLVNDIYGHDMGDKVLELFSELITNGLGETSVIGRIGGDEFVAFAPDFKSESQIKKYVVELNSGLVEGSKKLMGQDMEIPIGASVGVTYVPGIDIGYEDVFKQADKALYTVKQNGKHGYSIYDYSGTDSEADKGENKIMNLKTLSMILAERNVENSALQLDKDAFTYVYRFVMRYILRYHRTACKMLFTLMPTDELSAEEGAELCDKFCVHTKNMIRKSDLVMKIGKNQMFLFLTDIKEEAIPQVVRHVMRNWFEANGEVLTVTYEAEFIDSEDKNDDKKEYPWVVVVDDDISNLKTAGHVLSKNGMRVTALRSGKALLEFLKDNRPSLILLDIEMPEMDGFETIKILKAMDSVVSDIPVIFLTGTDDLESETLGLQLGAMDFIRKPFAPEILCMRAKHTIDLIKLQSSLATEVARKTRENESLLTSVIKSLADAIDAKDTYTNGHSGRVAEYSREIAKRFGYSQEEQDMVYMAGLLHDVGKIGVPDAVINKPSRLSDEEFELIKKHPGIGSQILENIKEMPQLATGAHWHHEKYGGGGYPDGISGDEIPEISRIIAVADAYDAMTSNRSYRNVMPQEKVRSEIERCMGTQFDPRFADIMIGMIDEDKEYLMREIPADRG